MIVRLMSSLMRWRITRLVEVSAVVVLLLVTRVVFGDVQYTIIDLGTLGGSSSYATGINANGQVVGYAYTASDAAYHAFRTAPNSPINSATDDLGTLGGSSSYATGINNGGQVVGQASTANGDTHAFRTASNSPINSATDDLGTLGGSSSYATGINTSGQVVGYSNNMHSFRTAANSPINPSADDLGTLGVTSSMATGINASGQVVGAQWTATPGAAGAFRTAPNSPINPATDYVGNLGDGGQILSILLYGRKLAINNSGQVVGGAETPGGEIHAFRTAPNSPINLATDDLGTLGGTGSWAEAINDNGHVVGSAYTVGNAADHAFVYDTKMTDLNSLIPASGWTLTVATGINNLGQIVGNGVNPDGASHAFLLTPLSLSTITPSPTPPPNTPGDGLKPVDPGTTPPSPQLKVWNSQSQSWDEVASWANTAVHPNEKTVVLVHGWKTADGPDAFANDNWVTQVAMSLKQQNSNANILAWDWQDRAKSHPSWPITLPALADIELEGLTGAAASARRGGAEQGVLLANDLYNFETEFGISNSRLQLIGHSNGGAVVGTAASLLDFRRNQRVARITTLDTPNLSLFEVPQADALVANGLLLLTGVNALQYVDPISASQVEAYYSNGILGRSAFGFGAPITALITDNVFNGRIYPGNPAPLEWLNIDHTRIPFWYADPNHNAAGPDQFVAGIDWSILGDPGSFRTGEYTEQGRDSHVFGTTTVTQQNTLSFVKQAVETFEDGTNWLGQHAEIFMRDLGNFAARITSGSDGYLWTDVSIPQDASYLTFDLKVETPDLGDFLTVSLGSEVIYYKGLNAADTDFWTVDPIFIGDFAGQSETLLFALNHVGSGTPSILLDNITFWGLEFSSVPEPSAVVLLIAGSLTSAAYALMRRRRASSARISGSVDH